MQIKESKLNSNYINTTGVYLSKISIISNNYLFIHYLKKMCNLNQNIN